VSTHLSPAAARRVFYTLSTTRWLPIGLVVGMMTLLPLDRGLSVSEALAAFAFSGWVVFFLELPTSGFADAFGRRPVYIVAAAVQVIGATVYLFAYSFWAFAVGSVLTGIFRALDSGPLEAWFVDTVHATDPGADVGRPLAAQGTILGLGIASGALVSSALVWWHPFAHASALNLPYAVFTCLTVLHLVAVLVLLREPRDSAEITGGRRAVQSAKDAPVVVREGVGMLRSNSILRGLVLVEVFWSIAMVVFETFQPIRLGELLGSEERAAAWMGVTASAGWGVFALGSALAGMLSSRLGVARTAMLARIFNSRGIPVHLCHAWHRRADAWRPSPPGGPGTQPGHGTVDELDDDVRGVLAGGPVARPSGRSRLQPSGHGHRRHRQPGRCALLPARTAARAAGAHSGRRARDCLSRPSGGAARHGVGLVGSRPHNPTP
jgi:MFS family permease